MRSSGIVFIIIMCFIINWGYLNAQTEIKKSVTKKFIDSTVIFSIKPQKVLTNGSVTVEGIQINYKAIALSHTQTHTHTHHDLSFSGAVGLCL